MVKALAVIGADIGCSFRARMKERERTQNFNLTFFFSFVEGFNKEKLKLLSRRSSWQETGLDFTSWHCPAAAPAAPAVTATVKLERLMGLTLLEHTFRLV